ncbi:ATP-grasp domain-containing protein [Alteromonas sp. 1_MG-2023]|uniref:ATP-grasp domain-containing protein n=1 Tax=Alteromonas sp. 1_MG-2023 TaxID=3062669 RepID=UPI0026E329E9|nr:ATP-grasp domain-containing protein [Alteromonas sp. 1_MG-2023]MDO6568445.1 ATP-grasp domain-containing protein [Alteromonas sp. 1_MG-2023]
MNVLISSANNKVPLLKALQDAVKRISPDGKVTAGDSNAKVLTRYFSDAFWHMPNTTDSNESLIISELIRLNITHVLPTRDGELLFWAKLKPALRTLNILVLVSDPSVVEICLDKLAFGQLPISSVIPTYDKLPKGNDSQWVVKERYGAGSQSLGIRLSSDNALAHANELNNPVFQPYCEGQEISVDGWLTQDSKVKALVCRVRDVVINGESQVTYTLPDCPFQELFTEILEALKLSGPVVLQAIISENTAWIIECNSRFGGASTLGIQAGVDSLYWSLCESSGINIRDIQVEMSTQSIRQVRTAVDYYY